MQPVFLCNRLTLPRSIFQSHACVCDRYQLTIGAAPVKNDFICYLFYQWQRRPFAINAHVADS